MERRTAPALSCVALVSVLALCACSGEKASSSDTATIAPTSTETASAAPLSAAIATAANPTASPTPDAQLAKVAFSDIKGIDGETAIKQLGALAVLETASGKFRPNDPISRAQYIRWLVKANNIYAGILAAPAVRIRLAEKSTPAFVDVPRSSPDFKYIQGMADAGLLVGYDKTHFRPDKHLSREELIAILVQRDLNGQPGTDPKTMTSPPSDYISDGASVSKAYWGLFHDDRWSYASGSNGNIPRIFGTIKTLHPQQDATREEAAVALQQISSMNAANVLKQKQSAR